MCYKSDLVSKGQLKAGSTGYCTLSQSKFDRGESLNLYLISGVNFDFGVKCFRSLVTYVHSQAISICWL